MKHIHTFESFLNESRIDKTSKAWYYEEVVVPGMEANLTTVKSDKDATKAASALVSYWEKKKTFDSLGFTISPENLKKLEDVGKANVDEVITIKVIDAKADKDYSFEIEVRDKALGVPAPKHLYVIVQRVG